jgi:hypothetical protein
MEKVKTKQLKLGIAAVSGQNSVLKWPTRDLNRRQLQNNANANTKSQNLKQDDQNKISLLLKKIDEESETPELISNIIYQKVDEAPEKQLLFSLLRIAIRYACFLDKYHESGESMYLEEANKHRSIFYSSIAPEQRQVLESIEKRIMPFWDYERQNQKRIEEEEVFSEEEIKEYISLRASDSFVYCAIASMFHSFTPEMTELFHKRLMLADIVDSIKDYEEDLRDRQPNILIMWLLNYMSKDEIPASLPHALNLSRKFKINLKIINFCKELHQQALKSEYLSTAPLLKKDFNTKYHTLVELLQ